MTNALDYTLSYNDFLLREAVNQQHMVNCINEAVALAGGHPELEIVTEGIVDKAKALWNKFVTFINKIFAKFMAFFNKFLDKDKEYLNRYSQIILKRPLKITGSITRYNLQLLANTKAEKFDTTKVEIYKNSFAETLAKSSLPSEIKKFGNRDPKEFIQFLRDSFCYGDENGTEDLNQLNMTTVYNYLADFKDKTEKELEKDRDAIVNSAQQFSKLFTDLERAQKNADNEKTQQNGSGENNEESDSRSADGDSGDVSIDPEDGKVPQTNTKNRKGLFGRGGR